MMMQKYYQRDERGKMSRCQAQTEETHVNNSTDTERKEEHVKIGREKLYEGARVVER